MTRPSIIATSGPILPGCRYLPSIIWGLVLATVLIIPFKIISYGYLPPDDSLRHAAKAVSGKLWPEILILRDDFTIDHNAGWHVLLRTVHLLTGWGAEDLVRFSIVSLLILVSLSALPWLRRPEAWLATLLVMNVASMKLLFRFTIFRRIQFLRSAPPSFLPWIAAMRIQDRLILNRSANSPPDLPQLEWRYGVRNTWIGRLPEEVREDE